MSAGLEIKGISLRFDGVEALRNLSLTIRPGARLALIGPNGAGKSTLGKVISGALEADTGTIHLNGRNLTHLGEAGRVRSGIARTFQITSLFPELTLRDNLRLAVLEQAGLCANIFRPAHGWSNVEREIDALVASLGLAHAQNSLVGNLAYGHQRLAEIGMALACKPRLLILDEPMAGVPASEAQRVLAALEALPDHVSLLLIEHDMDLVFRFAQEIAVLVGGALAAVGPPATIAADPLVRKAYLGNWHG